MKIRLYQSKDEAAKLAKNPTLYAELDGTLRAPCDVVNPVILIEAPNINMPLINYAEIPEFNRSYFAESPISVRTGLWELHLHCDVLTSWAPQIKALPALVRRASTEDKMLYDDKVRSYADSLVSTLEFPNALPSPTYILAMIGKDGDTE